MWDHNPVVMAETQRLRRHNITIRRSPLSSLAVNFVPVGDDSFFEEAACKGEPLETFFPNVQAGRGHGYSGHDWSEAREICESCPVRLECLRWALENEEDGFWGGTTMRERTGILGRRPGWDR
jgi:WhiB family redox-sensing transcriptional regulator